MYKFTAPTNATKKSIKKHLGNGNNGHKNICKDVNGIVAQAYNDRIKNICNF